MSARKTRLNPDAQPPSKDGHRLRSGDARKGRRAQRVLRGLRAIPSFAEELQLDLARPSDWFPWFLTASLFAKPISSAAALRTAALLLRTGIRTPRAVESTGWDGLVRLLDAGGYVRYDFSTADKLLGIARSLRDPETLRSLATEAEYPAVERQLTAVPGVGPKTVEIFLRELQGIWESSPPWSREARSAAHRLGLRVSGLPLIPSHRRPVESGLVRVWIEHCKPGHWVDCPLGPDCGCRPPGAGASARVVRSSKHAARGAQRSGRSSLSNSR